MMNARSPRYPEPADEDPCIRAASHTQVEEHAESGVAVCDTPAAALSAAEAEDVFDWRQGQEEDDGGGPLDDRVEGAIERINACRELMTQRQARQACGLSVWSDLGAEWHRKLCLWVAWSHDVRV